MVPTWKMKKRKTLKFVDEECYNKNEREGNWRLGLGRQGGVEKENKNLGTERCEIIKNLCIKIIIINNIIIIIKIKQNGDWI